MSRPMDDGDTCRGVSGGAAGTLLIVGPSMELSFQ